MQQRGGAWPPLAGKASARGFRPFAVVRACPSRWSHGVGADPAFSAASGHRRARCAEVSPAACAAAAPDPPRASRALSPRALGRQRPWRRWRAATGRPRSSWLRGARAAREGGRRRTSWGAVCSGEADRRAQSPRRSLYRQELRRKQNRVTSEAWGQGGGAIGAEPRTGEGRGRLGTAGGAARAEGTLFTSPEAGRTVHDPGLEVNPGGRCGPG